MAASTASAEKRWTDAQVRDGYGAPAMRELHGPAGRHVRLPGLCRRVEEGDGIAQAPHGQPDRQDQHRRDQVAEADDERDGLQCIACAIRLQQHEGIVSETLQFSGSRNEVRRATARYALLQLPYYYERLRQG